MTKTNDGLTLHDTFGTYGYSIVSEAELDGRDPGDQRRRGAGKAYGGDASTEVRMTQTEVALRLARHLAESPLLAGDV